MTKPGSNSKGSDRGTPVVSLDERRSRERGAAVSSSQRALWTFLGSTLVAPFLAAVVILVASLISGFVIGRGPASLLSLDPSGKLAWSAGKAVETYVWSAVPAGIAGAIAAAVVYWNGRLHWLAAASIAAIVSSAMAMMAGGMLATHITPIAFIAASVGVVLHQLLRRAQLLP